MNTPCSHRRCTTPAGLPFPQHRLAAVHQTLPLSVVLNGDNAARSEPVAYFELPHFESAELQWPWGPFLLRPSSGPIGGGTLVTISGVGFSNAAIPRCRFGDLPSVEGYNQYDGAATAEDGERLPGEAVAAVVCISPQHPEHARRVEAALQHLPAERADGRGLVGTTGLLDLQSFVETSIPIEVSLNGQQFSSTGLHFLYTPFVVVPEDYDFNVTSAAAVQAAAEDATAADAYAAATAATRAAVERDSPPRHSTYPHPQDAMFERGNPGFTI